MNTYSVADRHPVRRYKKIIKLSFLCLLISLSFTFGFILKAYAGNANDSVSAEPPLRMIDVSAGETLWSIASKYAPEDTNIKAYIAKIKKVNEMKTSSLQAGQILYLPE